MQREAKAELARAILETHKRREQSWTPGINGRPGHYDLSWDEAAFAVVSDPDLRPLVTAMLIAGYVDFTEWAEKFAGDN